MTARRALVAGGSVAGLFTAHLLRSVGWDVAVCERATGDLAGRGAGLGTRPELFAVLRRIGVPLDETRGVVPVRSRKYVNASGRVTHELPLASITTAWDRIYRALKNALPASCVHAGTSLERVVRNDSHVEAMFSDGSVREADLLVGADGLNSTARTEIFPRAQPRYAGYVAWRGVLDEATLPLRVHAELFEHMSFSVAGNELFLCMPMPGRDDETREGRRRFHFIWFRTVSYDAELPELCTDATGKCHGFSIAPPLIRAEVIASLREAARRTLPPQMAAMVELVHQPLLQPVYDLESPHVAAGRVALVGDAAFVARPHVATGVTKAALDAQCLVDALESSGGDIDAGLQRFDAAREPFGRSLVARARVLGSYLSPGPLTGEALRVAMEHRQPEAILREYGAAGSVHDVQKAN